MSWIPPVLAALAFAFVFAQFGGRLRASGALPWWIFAAFLMSAAVSPRLYQPLADLLGVQVVSNLVLAAATVFLFAQSLYLTARMTAEGRRSRLFHSRYCADRFLSAGRRSSELSRDGSRVLVVLPCYNEELSIPRLVPRLQALRAAEGLYIDFCFVDDGSVDDSRELLRKIASENHLCHMVNSNVSGVLLTGFHIGLGADFDYVVQCDGDGQHPVEEIPRLVAAARAEQSDLLIASRFAQGAGAEDTLQSTTLMRRFGSMILNGLLRCFWPGVACSDPTSGFRVYSRTAMKLLCRDMPDEYPEPEIIALLASHQLKVSEVPVVMDKRETGSSSISTWKSVVFMYKTVSALIGLRMRSFWR